MSSNRLRLSTAVLLFLALTFSPVLNARAMMPAISAANLVTQIGLAPRTPNVLPFSRNITVSFSYNTNSVGGVRIFARPFSGTSLSPNYSACPSPLYPAGSGTGTCNFTITSGATTVTQIRFQMWNSTQTTLLFQAFVPVSYQFKGNVSLVHSLALAPATPNILVLGQNVTVRFSYRTKQAGGVRIFARPFTGSALTPGYAACASPLYPVGSGFGSCSFTITSGANTVTSIRFQMWNATQTVLLFQTFVPVSYQFKGDANMVSSISLVPATPNILRFGQNVTIHFSYRTNQRTGVRIFARPFTGSALTPNYAACPSPLYPATSGTGTCTFTITTGTVTVTRIRFQVWNATQTTLLFEAFIPVHFQFR